MSKKPKRLMNYVLNPTQSETFVIGTETSSLSEPAAVQVLFGTANSLTNFQGSATLLKTNEKGIPLQGAVFTLYRVVGTTKTQVRTITSGTNGVVSITGLGSGDYELVETTAPSGYLRNNTPLTFTITDSTSVALPTINLRVTHQLSINDSIQQGGPIR